MNFGQALEAMKQGKKVARSIWGGYWFLAQAGFNEPNELQADEYGPNHEIETLIIAKLKDGGYAPATPYQADLLAEDWHIVE